MLGSKTQEVNFLILNQPADKSAAKSTAPDGHRARNAQGHKGTGL